MDEVISPPRPVTIRITGWYWFGHIRDCKWVFLTVIHLSKDNAAALRRDQRGQKRLVEQKYKRVVEQSLASFGFSVAIQSVKTAAYQSFLFRRVLCKMCQNVTIRLVLVFHLLKRHTRWNISAVRWQWNITIFIVILAVKYHFNDSEPLLSSSRCPAYQT